MDGLKDKVAIVTGGNSGFGRATSVAFARQGVRVVMAARSKAKADETLRMIEDVGGSGVFCTEYVKQGIRINAVCPGAAKTPLLDAVTGGSAEAEAHWASFMPIGRLGTPAEIADAIVWLCSDNSSFVVGHALAVDGGWAIQ